MNKMYHYPIVINYEKGYIYLPDFKVTVLAKGNHELIFDNLNRRKIVEGIMAATDILPVPTKIEEVENTISNDVEKLAVMVAAEDIKGVSLRYAIISWLITSILFTIFIFLKTDNESILLAVLPFIISFMIVFPILLLITYLDSYLKQKNQTR